MAAGGAATAETSTEVDTTHRVAAWPSHPTSNPPKEVQTGTDVRPCSQQPGAAVSPAGER